MRARIAICGRANVGKSTLFNILVHDAKALVHNRPGITRDWITGKTAAGFALMDTAGMEEGGESEIATAAWQSSMRQIQQADCVLLMVDARAGLLPGDHQVTALLRKMVDPQRVVLVVNKAENLTPIEALVDFYVLGFERHAVISAAHSQGIGYLLDTLTQVCHGVTEQPEPAAGDGDDKEIRLALIGRPNVGKSTLSNKIVGQERMLVSDMPGTTVDSIEIKFEHRGRRFALVDTAGVRRKAKTSDSVEKISSHRARVAAESADIIMLMFDVLEGVVHQDQLLANLVHGYGKSTLLVANKSDLLTPPARRRAEREARRELPFMEHAPFTLINAANPRFRGGMVVDRALAGYDLACNRSSANKVTKILQQVVTASEPPRSHGKKPRLRYAHQAGVNPPLIVVHGRHVELIKSPYVRYLSNQFARLLGYGGAPVRVRFKEASAKPSRMS